MKIHEWPRALMESKCLSARQVILNAAPFPFLGTLPSQGHQRYLLGDWMHNSPYLSAYSLRPTEQRTSSFTWAEVAMKQL